MWSVALLDSELWLVLCWESCCCCCCFTRNVPSWLNFTSLLTWHKRTVIFTGARWCHTECAELIDGFDDAFALLCTCVAAPFAVHWDVQQLLLFCFYQRDTHPQLFGERGCTGKKRQPFKNILICEERCTLGVWVLLRVTYHHQGWAPYPKDSSSPCLHYPSWMGKCWYESSASSHLWVFVLVISFFWHFASSLKWMSLSNKVFQILCDHEHSALTRTSNSNRQYAHYSFKLEYHWWWKSSNNKTKGSVSYRHCDTPNLNCHPGLFHQVSWVIRAMACLWS